MPALIRALAAVRRRNDVETTLSSLESFRSAALDLEELDLCIDLVATFIAARFGRESAPQHAASPFVVLADDDRRDFGPIEALYVDCPEKFEMRPRAGLAWWIDQAQRYGKLDNGLVVCGSSSAATLTFAQLGHALGCSVLFVEADRQSNRIHSAFRKAAADPADQTRLHRLDGDIEIGRAFVASYAWTNRLEPCVRERIGRSMYEQYAFDTSASRWADLPENGREAHRRSADDLARKLGRFGYEIVDAKDTGVSFDPSAENLETLSMMEHGSWVTDKWRNGWVLGDTRDAVAKTHPDLRPWHALSQDDRAKDRLRVARIPSLLADAGVGVKRIQT